jgi:hypothetical protein
MNEIQKLSDSIQIMPCKLNSLNLQVKIKRFVLSKSIE